MSLKNSTVNTMTNEKMPATENAPDFSVTVFGSELCMLRAKAAYFETLANELQNEVYSLDNTVCTLYVELRKHES